MGDKPSARVDAERNRRALLGAATDALAKDPDASLADIARLGGLTRATLYRHFGSRGKLLNALRDDALDSAIEAVAAARVEDGSALESLRRVISAMVSQGGRFWPLLIDGTDRDPGFQRSRDKAFAPVLGIIERGQRSGEVRADLSAQWALTALMALLTAAVRQAKGSEDDDVAERVFDSFTFGALERPPK